MKRTIGKLITMLLCFTMLVSLLPATALAAPALGDITDIPNMDDITDKLPTWEELGKLPELAATPQPEDPTGICGENIRWHLSLSTGLLTLSGSGAMTDYTASSSPWYGYRSKIKSVAMDAGITTIGAHAFDGLANMTAITMPTAPTSIGKNAFHGCKKLASIELSDSIRSIGISAFSYCSGLTKVTLPAGITTVPSAAFAYCSSLKEVVLHNGITKLGTFAFTDCSSLFNITLPEALTTIDSEAFSGCTALTAVEFPEGVTVGRAAFARSGLEAVSILEGVQTIDGFFSECASLKAVYLPKSIKEISKNSFNGCESLTDVYYGSSKLDWKNITVGENNDELLNAAFHYNASGLPEDIVVTTPTPTAAPTPTPTAAPTPTPTTPRTEESL